ncbi:hypothetical protein IGJ83_003201 [Enterococcus pernyi]
MKKLVIYSLCLMSIIFSGYQVYSEENSNQLAGGYTIEGIPNDHQLDKEVSYFYLKENPGEHDQVKVKLTNDSEKEKTLQIEITNANTNSNGLIDYTGQLKDHVSLKKPLNSIAKATQKQVKVPAKSSVETVIDIQMPEQKLSGVIAGGIVVSEKKEDKNKKSKLTLENVYTYTLGLVLTNESKVDPKHSDSVELENVGAVSVDGRKIVQADILNKNPFIFPNATVKGSILEKKSHEILKTQEKENVNIAPYSIFPFQFDWEKENLKEGQYIFEGLVESNGKSWKLEKEFTITSEEAKKINSESVFKVKIPEWLNYGACGLSVISILGTLYLLLRRKRQMVV